MYDMSATRLQRFCQTGLSFSSATLHCLLNRIGLVTQIPTRVELHMGAMGSSRRSSISDSDSTITWRRLGSIGFADNEASKYCARELKSIGHLDEDTLFVKIVILGAYDNPLNKFHQVSAHSVDIARLGVTLAKHGDCAA